VIIKFCLVFPKIFLLHKVVRDAKKVEKHCFRGQSGDDSVTSLSWLTEINAFIYVKQAEYAETSCVTILPIIWAWWIKSKKERKLWANNFKANKFSKQNSQRTSWSYTCNMWNENRNKWCICSKATREQVLYRKDTAVHFFTELDLQKLQELQKFLSSFV